MKNKKKVKQNGVLENLTIEMFRTVINVMIHDTCKDAVKISHRMRKVAKKHNWDNMLGCFFYDEEENIFAIILSKNADIDTVAHECFHAVMRVIQVKGVVYCEESEEVFAYVLGWLTKEVWKINKAYNKK